MFYIGCPMWGYKAWVGRFFAPRTPASEFLRLYSRKLTTVEGNTTFYATPSADTVVRWRQETPATFRFCPKVSRSISHETLLAESKDATLAFINRLRGLETRLGTFFLQLPPQFSPRELSHLHTFLQFWPTDVRLAVEVRHPDFYQPAQTQTLNELLSEFGMARVIMDTRPIRVGSAEEQQTLHARERKPDLPVLIESNSDLVFVRYIGHPRMEVNEPFLDTWARQLAAWFQEGKTLYVFCHCPFEEHSPFICQALYGRVRTLLPQLPPLPDDAKKPEDGIEQQRLF